MRYAAGRLGGPGGRSAAISAGGGLAGASGNNARLTAGAARSSLDSRPARCADLRNTKKGDPEMRTDCCEALEPIFQA